MDLLLPGGVALEYLASVPVYPLPRAGARVVGLMQLRGHPIVVLDGATQPVASGAAVCRMPVLVVGAAPEGAALVVDDAPRPVNATRIVADAARPDCPFGAALGDAVGDDGGRLWWTFDAKRMFAVLAEAR